MDPEEVKRALAVLCTAMTSAGAALGSIESKHLLDDYWQNVVREARAGLTSQEVAAAFFSLGVSDLRELYNEDRPS